MMKCRKCGNDVLDDVQRCSMCDANQHEGGNSNAETSCTRKDDRLANKRTRSNNTVIAIISVLVTIAVVSIGFVLFHVIDFESFGSDQVTDAYFLLNQANRRSSSVHGQVYRGGSSGRVYVTEEMIYIATRRRGEVVVFDHDLNRRSSFRIHDDWFNGMLIHVTADAIYYTLSPTSGDLYRYDRATSENQQIASDIYHLRIVGDQVFYLSDRRIHGNIYALNLVSNEETGEVSIGERDVVFQGSVSEYFVNPVDNIIVFRDRDSLFHIDFEGNNLERITNDVYEFSYDGEIVTWFTRTYESIYTLNLDTNEQTQLDVDIEAFSSVFIISDYIFSQGWYGFDFIGREDPTDPPLLGRDLQYFSVVGNYIIYEIYDPRHSNHNTYVLDIGGDSRVLIER